MAARFMMAEVAGSIISGSLALPESVPKRIVSHRSHRVTTSCRTEDTTSYSGEE